MGRHANQKDDKTMTTWHEDSDGNRCSEEYFGSAEAAKAALASLVDCVDCVRCVHCKDCEDCVDCLHCVRCADCEGKPLAAPVIERIHSAVYSAASAPGALEMSAGYTCDNV
jgi:hypothetical protein